MTVNLKEVPRDKRLLVARLLCLASAMVAVWYCVVAAISPLSQHVSLLRWQGTMGRPLPIPQALLLVAGGLLTPLVVTFARAVTGAGRPAYDEGSREAVSNAAFGRWLNRQIVYYGVAGLPAVGALALGVLYGAEPLVWLVAAETSFMFLLYMPRARDLDPEAL